MDDNVTENLSDLPDDMHLYVRNRWPSDVPRIPWNQLTLEQKRLIMEARRFGGFCTGSYQAVSFDGKNGQMLI